MLAPHTRRPRHRLAVAATLVAALALTLGACGDDGDDEATEAGSTTTADSGTSEGSTSTEGTASTDGGSSSSTTTGGDATTTTVAGTGLVPGDPCDLEEGIADCIDPDGDGEGVYLERGDECIANAPDPIVCEDSDGDGVAGTPDEFGDLPTCAADVPPPCNNPPGGGEDGGTEDGGTEDPPADEPEDG